MSEAVVPAAARERAVYLDYSATTPVDPRVALKMNECLLMDGEFGNPASTTHAYGWDAAERVEEARVHVASLINADPRAIVWTSGATESDNLALKGVAEAAGGGHLVTTSYEHKAVLDTAKYLEGEGVQATPTGRGSPANRQRFPQPVVEQYAAAVGPDRDLRPRCGLRRRPQTRASRR